MKKVKLTITQSACRSGYFEKGQTFVVEDLCPPLCHELWHISHKKTREPPDNFTVCPLTICSGYDIIIQIVCGRCKAVGQTIEYTEKESKWRTLRL